MTSCLCLHCLHFWYSFPVVFHSFFFSLSPLLLSLYPSPHFWYTNFFKFSQISFPSWRIHKYLLRLFYPHSTLIFVCLFVAAFRHSPYTSSVASDPVTEPVKAQLHMLRLFPSILYCILLPFTKNLTGERTCDSVHLACSLVSGWLVAWM